VWLREEIKIKTLKADGEYWSSHYLFIVIFLFGDALFLIGILEFGWNVSPSHEGKPDHVSKHESGEEKEFFRLKHQNINLAPSFPVILEVKWVL
jgi:hypothetical protein